MTLFGRSMHLQSKFRLVAALGLLIWLTNFSLVYIEIRHINQAAFGLERIEDVYNAVLEVRRYEKNYLLYQGRDNLDEITRYLGTARDSMKNFSVEDQTGKDFQATLDGLTSAIGGYEKIISVFRQADGAGAPSETVQEEMRDLGKRMVDLSHDLLSRRRSEVADAARNALRWPLFSMGLILLLFAGGAFLVNQKVVRPLVNLEQATKNIGRGDFSPVQPPLRIESEVDRLTQAFNRMVEELEARQEQIIHSRKIASLGTLVSGVAHELNNPINNIILTIDTLTGGREIPEERRAVLMDDILQQAIRASGIVKNLLDFSRAEGSEVRDIDLATLLRDTLKLTHNQIKVNRVKLFEEIDSDLPIVQGNRQGLQQVFINLISNAVHAMPNGGELRVKAGVDENNWISATFQDTGEGIPEEYLSRIFDPFFTTKEVGRGTGMGLSVSYGIIKKHGGRIMVDSRPGKGSVFTVLLPKAGETIIE